MALSIDIHHNSIAYHYADLQLLICYDVCHYAECRYAECRYAKCRYAEWRNAKVNISQ